jgi:hypothetical protein
VWLGVSVMGGDPLKQWAGKEDGDEDVFFLGCLRVFRWLRAYKPL